MTGPAKLPLACAVAVVLALGAAGCGTDKVKVAKSDPTYQGAILFKSHCGGCHTLSYAGTHGSASNIRTRERNDGPNFNVRCESVQRVLFALENGGFSGAIMPQNIVVGREAQEVAQFVAKFAGRKAPKSPSGGGPCAGTPT
jgi:mono/diheme cytochrome c family protein